MTLQTLLALFGLTQQRQWAAAASLAMLWLWHAASDSSAIPIPAKWRPVAVASCGVVYGVLQSVIGGMPVEAAIWHGAGVAVFTYGLAGMVFEGVFGGKPLPKWLATLLLLFPIPPPPPAPPAPPPLPQEAPTTRDLKKP